MRNPCSHQGNMGTETFPTLYAVASNGKVKVWSIEVTGSTCSAVIRTTYGYDDGKLVQNERNIDKGKNVGRANETTPMEQAISEARKKFQDKITEGYAQDIAKSIVPGVASGSEQGKILPMLAHDFHKRGKDIKFPCFVQPKLDGVRCIYHDGQLSSRNGKPFGHLDHILRDLGHIKENIVLDGELYSDTLSFQIVVGLVKKQTLTKDDNDLMKQVQYWVYDCVNDDTFEDRMRVLRSMFDKYPTLKHVQEVDTDACDKREDIHRIHNQYTEQGYEGLMLRNKSGRYQLATRSKDLQKFKEFEEDEFQVTDFTQGEGSESGLVIWICKTQKGQVFQVRPRGTHEQRAELFKQASRYVGQNLTVRFQELTDGGIPRFPVGITFRDYE